MNNSIIRRLVRYNKQTLKYDRLLAIYDKVSRGDNISKVTYNTINWVVVIPEL